MEAADPWVNEMLPEERGHGGLSQGKKDASSGDSCKDETEADSKGVTKTDSEETQKSGKKPVMVQAALDMAENDPFRLLEKA